MITLTTAGLFIDNGCFGSGMLLARITSYKTHQDGKPLNHLHLRGAKGGRRRSGGPPPSPGMGKGQQK